ncbi:MAG: tRNA threonylcarbamoyladenosine dehydratase [Bacteroidales bacterium]|nr:tRNA threonylcarbamoyladenosine dehydratase [Bacteroidales bacterium]
MKMEQAIYNRTALLVGDKAMEAFAAARVIIFGVGGVGSWCAEGLLRSGVTHITLVDSDKVSATNVNRQEMATTLTVGRVKVEALRERLLEINPSADIKAIQAVYCEETSSRFDLDSYDYVVDAIDSLKDKMHLILKASASSAKLFSAMGAALKIDPTRIRVAEFWSVRGCPLASAIRKRFRQNHTLPSKEFMCVYDDEVLPNRGTLQEEDSLDSNRTGSTSKAVINGTMAHITAIFGFTLSGLILQDITARC